MTVPLSKMPLAALALIISCASPGSAHAQEAQENSAEQQFVSAGLWIGLHASSAFDSAITARLPSGTPLAVLLRQGGLARVRTEGGEEGWIDEAFLSATPPAVTPPPPPMADAGTVMEQRDALASELATMTAERDALVEEKAELLAAASEPAAGSSPADGTPAGSDQPDAALAELAGLKAENARLRQMQGGATPTMVASLVPRHLLDPSTAPGPLRIIASWGIYTWLAAAFALMLAFFLGAALIQWDVRRRHGGFRV